MAVYFTKEMVVACCVLMAVVGLAQCHLHQLKLTSEENDALDLAQELSRERDMANKLLHRLMDVAYDTLRDLGGSDGELKEVARKRSIITRCYFQAIACY